MTVRQHRNFRDALNPATRADLSLRLRVNACADEPIESANTLRLRANGPPRPILCVPGVQVDVQPSRRQRHKTLEEQSTDDRAGKRRARNIAEIGNLARELVVVAGPQRQWPDGVSLFLGAAAQSR